MKTCVLVLDNLRSVENTASIFRTADGLGVKKIYLVGTTPAPLDRFGRERGDFSKVSLGAEKSVDWEYREDTLGLVEELKSQGFQIVALEQSKDSVEIKSFAPQDQFALIVGNEVEGVSKDLVEAADKIVEIEMRGEKESLNVAVATGIALFVLI